MLGSKRISAVLRATLAAVLATGLLGTTLAQAQSMPKVTKLDGAPASFLFVGTSFFYYNNSMHSLFTDLLRKGETDGKKTDFRAVSATISGAGLNWHNLEAYFNKDMASYRFDETNDVVFTPSDKPFDAVVMLDCSQCPIHPKLSGLFHDTVKKDAGIARSHGAVPVLFMTWAYADKPDMTAELAEQYVKAGNDNDVLVIPAGLAFAEALKRRPGLALYQPDKRHPTLIGSYLSAATAYASITGRSPVGNASRGLPSNGIVEPEMATFLQNVAADTVARFYGR